MPPERRRNPGTPARNPGTPPLIGQSEVAEQYKRARANVLELSHAQSLTRSSPRRRKKLKTEEAAEEEAEEDGQQPSSDATSDGDL